MPPWDLMSRPKRQTMGTREKIISVLGKRQLGFGKNRSQ